jgi:probable F420-dependent oxidoreductase
MAAAAEATTTLRIGTHVLGNDYRHPVLLAREAAAIDLMSDGRLEFGLGSGYAAGEYQKLGIPYDVPGVRVGRLEEAIQIIKGLWAGKPLTFTGRCYSIQDIECIPRPIQKPHPPILIGGGGKRVLSIAAREATTVGLNFKSTPEGGPELATISPEATAEKVEWIRQAAGTRFNDIELTHLTQPNRADHRVCPFCLLTTKTVSTTELIVGQASP